MDLSKKTIRHDKARASAVQALVQLAAKHPPEDITMTQIAAAMGLTQRALFRSFLNKDVIEKALIEWIYEIIKEQNERLSNSVESPLLILKGLFYANIHFLDSSPGILRILIHELNKPQTTPLKKEICKFFISYTGYLEIVIEQGKHTNEILHQINTRGAAIQFISAIHGLLLQVSIGYTDQKDIMPSLAEYWDIFERSLRVVKNFNAQ